MTGNRRLVVLWPAIGIDFWQSGEGGGGFRRSISSLTPKPDTRTRLRTPLMSPRIKYDIPLNAGDDASFSFLFQSFPPPPSPTSVLITRLVCRNYPIRCKLIFVFVLPPYAFVFGSRWSWTGATVTSYGHLHTRVSRVGTGMPN